MKLAKGVIKEEKPAEASPSPHIKNVLAGQTPVVTAAAEPTEKREPVVVEKEHLFQTQQVNVESSRNYLKLFAIVAAVVVVAGSIIFYLTLPGVGDKVKAPKGLEDQVRDYLLIKEKRTATDMSVYYCGKFYWAAVDVETRPDIPGSPINSVSRYRVTAIQADGEDWRITATPVTGTDAGVPCS